MTASICANCNHDHSADECECCKFLRRNHPDEPLPTVDGLRASAERCRAMGYGLGRYQGD